LASGGPGVTRAPADIQGGQDGAMRLNRD